MNRAIRLLMGITLSEVGGSQKVVYSILSGLPETDYEITLVTSPGGELLDWVSQLNLNRENKIQVITLDCIRRDISPICDLLTFSRLVALMKGEKYDVAHFHNSKMGTLGRIAAKLCGVPKILYTMHGLNLNKNNTGRMYPVLSLIEKMIARFTTKVIFVSKHDMEAGIRNGWATEENACLIYNGMPEPDAPERLKRQSSEQPPVIAFVARLAEPKQPEFMIQVSAKLLSSGYEHRLWIIGDGPKTEECKNLIHSLGVEDKISLLGKCDNVPTLLSQADIFCLFSKSEGLPISVLEAMQAGLPVIASDVGGMPELVEHEGTGYLVHGFNEDLTVGYLKELIYDMEKSAEMGGQARMAAACKFSLEGMVSRYRELYQSAIFINNRRSY